jgi:MFS superfamily sulfate permease-like transporter
MFSTKQITFRNSLAADLSAGLVVFLVALPLCLGIALASGVPAFSGIVAAVVGGILVSALSKSPLGVTGPAAGLTVVVLEAVRSVDTINIFFCAVVIAGCFQIIFALLKLDLITLFIPTAVIKGMLAGIGALIILKQIPNMFGADVILTAEAPLIFKSLANILPDGSALEKISNSLANLNPVIFSVSIFSFLVHLFWDSKSFLRNFKFKKSLPSALLVTFSATLLFVIIAKYFPTLSGLVNQKHFVTVPFLELNSTFFSNFTTPDFSYFFDLSTVLIGLEIAIIASIETLLSSEAVDRLDPYRRTTPTNRELWAQGAGNIFSGLLGGLPVTAVVARSSANVYAGGRTKTSAIFHGLLIALAVLAIPSILNLIPIAALSVILVFVGLKLTGMKVLKEARKQGRTQFTVFTTTYLSVVFLDLLDGVIIGVILALVIVLVANVLNKVKVESSDNQIKIILKKDVNFLNKADLRKKLSNIPDSVEVVIDGTNCISIDSDIIELINEFEERSKDRGIKVEKKSLENKRFSLTRINLD